MSYLFFHFFTSRAPIASFGGGALVNNRKFTAIGVVEFMKKNAARLEAVVPKQGFIGVGNFDENWGFFR